MTQFSGTANPSQSGGVTAIFPMDFYQFNRDPTPNDSRGVRYYRPGDHWENTTNNNLWYLANLKNNIAKWILISGGSGALLNLLGDTGVAVPNGAGQIQIAGGGGTNMVTTASGSTVIVSLIASPQISGSLNVNGTIQTISGSIVAAAGDLNATNQANNTTGAALNLIKRHNNAVVQTGDNLGSVTFLGYDGVSLVNIRGAAITSNVTGTVAMAQIPSNLNFFTASAVGALTNRITISQNGEVTIAAPDTPGSQYSLTVAQDVRAQVFYATGDDTGVAGTNSFTNVRAAASVGVNTLVGVAGGSTNNGYIKFYVNGVAAYVPYFLAP